MHMLTGLLASLGTVHSWACGSPATTGPLPLSSLSSGTGIGAGPWERISASSVGNLCYQGLR